MYSGLTKFLIDQAMAERAMCNSQSARDNMDLIIQAPHDIVAPLQIKKTCAGRVIFNDPATIIQWNDGTKTVVRCQPDSTYDRITGVALCYMKKALGNTSKALNDALRKAMGEESVNG